VAQGGALHPVGHFIAHDGFRCGFARQARS
jgi:hypothetical protein